MSAKVEATGDAAVKLPRPIAAVLDRYRDLRHRVDEENNTSRWKYWQHASATSGNSQVSRWKPPASGRGTVQLRDILREEIGDDAALREMLLLEAARRGCLYLVRELLCPTPYDGGEKVGSERMTPVKSPPPVSMNSTDDNKNTILHLAVLGGNAPLVRWLLRYSESYFGFRSKAMNHWEWNSTLNDDLKTPLSLAIDHGRLGMLAIFLKLEQIHVLPVVPFCGFSLPMAIQKMKCLDAAKVIGTFQDGSIDVHSVMQKVLVKLREKKYEAVAEDSRHISFLTFFEARYQAPSRVRNAVDRWMRYYHVKHSELNLDYHVKDKDKFSLPKIREAFGGLACPWWNSSQSDFDIDRYIQNRSEEENKCLFSLLCSAVNAGHHDSATWLLKTFKAPPSVRSYRADSHFLDGLWYLNNAEKIAEKAVLGWLDSIVVEMLESSGDRRNLYRPSSAIIERMMLPRDKEYTGSYGLIISVHQLPVEMTRFIPPNNGELSDFWDSVWSNVKGIKKHSSEKTLFGVKVKVYVATKLAGRFSLESFEQSGHGKLVSYFLETAYSEDPGFTAADLPRLSCFVALDLLVFFQFLTKARRNNNNGEEYSYLNLNIPLLFPPASELQMDAEDDDEMDLDEDDDECVICLESMPDPYALSCGHRFHQQCLFRYTFPEVREAEEDELDENSSPEERAELAHQVLAEHEDLSFILGFCTCPYCRKEVKPSLPRAFALNIADGLWRTASHRRYAPNSPSLDISECRPGTTVGEALLGFSACCGAITIFEWLVKVKNVDPESFKARDGINILYVALSHNQLLIVRWLCENGYSHLLLGGLNRDQFDDDSSFRHLNTVLSEHQAARIDFVETEEDLSNRRYDYVWNYEYTEEEKKISDGLEDGLTEEEENIANIRAEISQKSPIHMLLMSGRNEISSLRWENAFMYLQSRGELEGLLPKGWCHLVLTCSTNERLRNEAKRFIAYQIISRPKDLDYRALKQKVEENASRANSCSEETVKSAVEFQPKDMSVLDIMKTVESTNFWCMAVSGTTDWKHFVNIATSLGIWNQYSLFKLFDGREMRREIIQFVGDVVVKGCCLSMLACFCKMESFTQIFDLYTEVDTEYVYSFDISLRKMVKDRNRWDTFYPLFTILDRVDDAAREIYRCKQHAMEAISNGKTLDEIKQGIESTKQLALTLPDCERPFGVDYQKNLTRFFDPSRWDLLDFNYRIDDEYKSAFDVLTHRQDSEIINWALSLTLKSKRVDEGFNETTLIHQITEKFCYCTNSLFGLEAFVKYFTETDCSSKYFGKRKDLFIDLIGLENHEDDIFEIQYLYRGLPLRTIGTIFFYCNKVIGLREERNLAEKDPVAWIQRTKEKVDKNYRLLEWFLSRPEVREFFATSENAEQCSKLFLFNDKLCDASVGPHITFRIMKLFMSYGLDPLVPYFDKDGRPVNLVEQVLCNFNNDYRESTEERDGIIKMWTEEDGDVYKTCEGHTVDSAHALVRWLVLEIGINIQHLYFNDITDRSHERNLFSREEWDALKEEQRKSGCGAK